MYDKPKTTFTTRKDFENSVLYLLLRPQLSSDWLRQYWWDYHTTSKLTVPPRVSNLIAQRWLQWSAGPFLRINIKSKASLSPVVSTAVVYKWICCHRQTVTHTDEDKVTFCWTRVLKFFGEAAAIRYLQYEQSFIAIIITTNISLGVIVCFSEIRAKIQRQSIKPLQMVLTNKHFCNLRISIDYRLPEVSV